MLIDSREGFFELQAVLELEPLCIQLAKLFLKILPKHGRTRARDLHQEQKVVVLRSVMSKESVHLRGLLEAQVRIAVQDLGDVGRMTFERLGHAGPLATAS